MSDTDTVPAVETPPAMPEIVAAAPAEASPPTSPATPAPAMSSEQRARELRYAKEGKDAHGYPMHVTGAVMCDLDGNTQFVPSGVLADLGGGELRDGVGARIVDGWTVVEARRPVKK